MKNQESFDAALGSNQPVLRLKEVIRELLEQGYTSEKLLADLEEYRTMLQRTDRSNFEDIVLEVMDFTVGWCSPHMKL